MKHRKTQRARLRRRLTDPKRSGIVIALSVLILAACALFPGCEADKPDETQENDPMPIAETMETEAETMNEIPETTAEEWIFEPQSADWLATIEAAAARANGVSGKFTNPEREKFLVKNGNMSLLYDLTTDGHKGVEALCNADGVPYFTDTMDARIVLPDGARCSAAYSPKNGRMNSHRLGYYYYDFRFCDQLFVNGEALAKSGDRENGYDILSRSGTWGTHDTSSVRKKDGMMSYTVTSDYDPYIYTSVRFQTADYDAVRITIRTEAASTGEIFIIAGSHNGYSAEQRTGLTVTPGTWTTVTVPLTVIPDYTGTVSGFRLDFGAEKDEVVEIRELTAIKTGVSTAPFALERVFHTYSDKVHEILRIVATDAYTGGGRFETETAIPAESVEKILFKNAGGESATLDGFGFAGTEFVAFDIRDAGIYGIILPDKTNNGDIRVELRDGYYVVTRGIDLKSRIRAGEDAVFGQRLYTSADHDFDGIRRAAEIERNPLKNVKITAARDGAKYAGYDALAGYYRFTVQSSDFNRAYYREPDKHYAIDAEIRGDGIADRTIYLLAAEGKGQLECSAVLDEDGRLLPIPVEVCKNFCGEYEEPLFDPHDPAYGEVYFPVTIAGNEVKRLTILHLYQNWGKFPLKQLSSIAFHIPHYHLSVGVTETNCIAPYFVYGKDGWTLPDFRANSAPLWSGQPQHTSAGRLYFLRYTDADGNACKSESQSAEIISAGPVYADIEMEYLSDDGKIRATYRHAEVAQTDENRTYYHIALDVLDDVTIADFRRDFSFFTFDGRAVYYRNIGYLGEDGIPVIESVQPCDRVITLGREFPYYDYFGGNVEDSVNFALIVRNASIVIGGEAYDGSFVLYDRADGTLNTGALSLDLGEVTLRKGDRMELEIILLPWGYSTNRTDRNVRVVREDSCLDPVRLTVLEGEAMEDRFIPSVLAMDNRASFRLEGGRNTAAVR
ncbi:MAG: hypothetical protein J6V24_07720, partial [Clostridia bacterium]|nr:hypothetical protein [Clostridia bacterium]